jgi:hypothetical protein
MKLLNILFLLFSFSCADIQMKDPQQKSTEIIDDKGVYEFQDVSGKMVLKRYVNVKSDNKVVTSSRLISEAGGRTKLLEKNISISEYGTLRYGKNIKPLMRPFASQYTVWFDGKEYFTQLKLNKKKKALDIFMKSPEEKWNGKKRVPFPKGEIFCFFGQIPECLKSTEFISKAIKEKQGDLRFHVIWDSYPYFKEMYSNLNSDVFSEASISYDGEIDGNYKFKVDIAGHIIFYHYNNELEFEKLFWISQGMSVIRRQ